MNVWTRLVLYLKPYPALLVSALIAMGMLAVTSGLYPAMIDLLSTSLFGGTSALDGMLGDRLESLASTARDIGLSVDVAQIRASMTTHLFTLFGAVVAIKAVSQAVRFFAMGALAQRVIRDLRLEVFGAIARQDATFFADKPSGELVSRVINDAGLVERAATYAIPVMFGDLLKVAVLATMCLWQYPDLSLVSVIVLPLAALPIVGFGKLLKRFARQAQEALGDLTTRITETLGGVRVTQIFGREAHEVDRFDTETKRYLGTMMRSVLVRALQTPVMELIGVAALLGTMAWAQQKIVEGTIRPGEVIAFMLALVLMYEPLKALGRLNGIVMPGIAAAERIFEVIDRPSQITDAPNAVVLPPMSEALAFEGVTFSYAGADRPALRGLELRLERGKVVALVGPSGSGKSTAAALVPRLYDPTGGRITIDGTPITDATVASLRAQIAVVSQETYLFNDTIAANIEYGKPGASRGEIEAAARHAYAHDFIEQLPRGYETVPGERGHALSGGQRQRIAIARAFLADAPVLVLDEATSALDTESEREVQRALDALLENRTALVIAHRLSTVRNADEIVVLEGGAVVERGTHAELSSNGGVYASLVKLAEEPSRCA